MIFNPLQWPLAGKVTAVAACAALAGGGVAAVATSASSEPGVTTYLCAHSADDMLLQWKSPDGTDLSGTYQLAQLTGTAPSEQVSASQGELSGTLDGQAVTLSVGFSQPLYGQLAGSTLTLNVPQQDGTIQQAQCTPAGIPAWNKAVGNLDGQASNDNSAANQAAAQQAHDQAVAQAQQALANDTPPLVSGTSALNSDTSLAAVISQMKTDYQTEQKDWQTEQSASCSDPGTVDSDSGTVNSDSGAVNSDSGAEGSAVAALKDDDIQAVQTGLTDVKNDLSTLQGLGAAPGTSSSAAISAGGKALTSAGNAISWANGQTSTISSDAQKLATTAQNYADSHCGP